MNAMHKNNIGPVSQKTLEVLVSIARQNGLSNPLGRAYYALNRKLMGWPIVQRVETDGYWGPAEPLFVLRRCRPSTAARWVAHIRKGGSIRVTTMSADQWRAHQRNEARERRARWREIARRNAEFAARLAEGK